jgi:hypothetical protein
LFGLSLSSFKSCCHHHDARPKTQATAAGDAAEARDILLHYWFRYSLPVSDRFRLRQERPEKAGFAAGPSVAGAARGTSQQQPSARSRSAKPEWRPGERKERFCRKWGGHPGRSRLGPTTRPFFERNPRVCTKALQDGARESQGRWDGDCGARNSTVVGAHRGEALRRARGEPVLRPVSLLPSAPEFRRPVRDQRVPASSGQVEEDRSATRGGP